MRRVRAAVQWPGWWRLAVQRWGWGRWPSCGEILLGRCNNIRTYCRPLITHNVLLLQPYTHWLNNTLPLWWQANSQKLLPLVYTLPQPIKCYIPHLHIEGFLFKQILTHWVLLWQIFHKAGGSIPSVYISVCLSRGEKGGPLGGGVGILIRSIIRLWQSHQPICSAGYWFISIKKILKSISPCCCQFTKVEARYKETIQSERGKKNLL